MGWHGVRGFFLPSGSDQWKAQFSIRHIGRLFFLVVWKKVLWIEVSETVFIFHEWRDKEKKARLRIKHFPYRRNIASTKTLLTHLMTGNSRTIEIKFKSLVKPYRLRRAKVHNLLSIFSDPSDLSPLVNLAFATSNLQSSLEQISSSSSHFLPLSDFLRIQ